MSISLSKPGIGSTNWGGDVNQNWTDIEDAFKDDETVARARSLNDFRLTLASGDPVPTSNLSAQSTLYLTPYVGKQIGLYYGSDWSIRETAEVSISLSGCGTNTVQDVFAYWSGSAVVLELVAWSGTGLSASRSTGLVRQDGVWCKSGDTTRRYIGTIAMMASGSTCDKRTQRCVWNWQNRVLRPAHTGNTTSSWTYSTGTWRYLNAGSGNLYFYFVCGLPATFDAHLGGEIVGNGYLGLTLDSPSAHHTYFLTAGSNPIYGCYLIGNGPNEVGAGYHWLSMCEYANGSTITVYGQASESGPGYGSRIGWWC